ncbi:hypothetical protein Tsubulata_033466, partial [Turnera subulata]
KPENPKPQKKSPHFLSLSSPAANLLETPPLAAEQLYLSLPQAPQPLTMDLDDLDDLGAPKPAPSRVSKFAPRSAKFKPQPKQETSAKPEPPAEVKIPKPEPGTAQASEKKEEEVDVKPNIDDMLKPGPSGSDGAVKMEIDGERDGAADVAVEEEDVVVREIDVYFTRSIGDGAQLYVMQYPLRPCWRPYELDERCKEVRLMPGNGNLEMDLSIDDSTNWDADFGNRLKMTKQVLSSSGTLPRAAGYCVGVLTRNKLYMNPVDAVVQIRPSLEHLKSGGSKRRSTFTSDAEVAIKLENSNGGKPVGPSKKQNKRMEPGNEQEANLEETWLPLKFHGSKSDLSFRYLQKMLAEGSSSIEFAMNPYDYMSSLCPGASNNNSKNTGLSKRDLLKLPLEERLKKLFEVQPVYRLSALKHHTSEYPIELVLEKLQQLARLVQGLWVLQSDLIPDLGMSKVVARDNVLLLFSKSAVISLSQINHRLRKDMISFLNVYAVERPSLKDWKFKEQTDASFFKLYPDIVKKQEESWAEVEKNIAVVLARFDSKPGMKKQITKPPTNPVKPLNSDKSAMKSASVGVSQRTMTNETREALRKALPKVFSNHKVCSFQLICRSLRELALSLNGLPKADPRLSITAAFGADAPPEELQEVIDEVAIKIHGFYVLKSSPEHPEYDPLRKVVIDLLLARGPDAKIKKTEVVELARRDLKREITNNEYNKVMTDLCESKGSAWVMKSGDGKP